MGEGAGARPAAAAASAQAAEEESADGDAVRIVLEGAVGPGAAPQAGEERTERAGGLPPPRFGVGSPLLSGSGELGKEALALEVEGLVLLQAG